MGMAQQATQSTANGKLTTFVFTASTPATIWNIAHNLNAFPGVTFVDITGNVIEPHVQYIDSNNVTATFNIPIAGNAYMDGSVAGSTGGLPNTVWSMTESSPAMVWNLAHNLAAYPAVVVIDGSGNLIEPDVLYVDSNNITLTFGVPTIGIVNLISKSPSDTVWSMTQSSPSGVWNLAHNQASYPVVVVVDNGGNLIDPDILYVDINNIRLVFSAPTSGIVYLI